MSVLKSFELGKNPDITFKECKLDREKYADTLTSILDIGKDGFVLALNNKWGSGKTTFVKMWENKIRAEYNTLYFNAWENDFELEPMVAIISKFKTLFRTQKHKNKFKTIIKNAGIIAKNMTPVLIETVVEKHVGNSEKIKDVFKAASNAFVEIFDEQVNEYINKEKSLNKFKTQLCDIIKEISPEKPIVFFIDELDRCRPDYAVEVLEKVKHFFNVDGIVFILVIDKEHLSKSICGYYGNNEINTDEYLRRFIDIEFSLPEPETSNFLENLISTLFYTEPKKESEIELINSLRESLKYLITSFNFSLRQSEKLLIHFKLVTLKTKNIFYDDRYNLKEIILLLIIIKVLYSELFNKIYSMSLSLEQFDLELCKVLKILPITGKTRTLMFNIEIGLVGLYAEYLKRSEKNNGQLAIEDKNRNSLTLQYNIWVNKDMSIEYNDRINKFGRDFEYFLPLIGLYPQK